MKKHLLILLATAFCGVSGYSQNMDYPQSAQLKKASMENNSSSLFGTGLNGIQTGIPNYGAQFLNFETNGANDECDIFYETDFEDGLGALNSLHLAVDFVLPANETAIINGIRLDMINSVTNVMVTFHADNGNSPGAAIGSTMTITPASQTLVGTSNGSNVYDLELNFPTPVSLTAGSSDTKYWFSLKTTMGSGGDNYWTYSTTVNNGTYYFYSADNGISWVDVGPLGFPDDGNFTLDLECDTETDPCAAVGVPYYQDFNSAVVPAMPECTTVENAGTGNNWHTYNGTDGDFTGTYLRYSYHTTNSANSWFYTQGINLTAGATYKISYQYGSEGSAAFPESLKVAYGSDNTYTAMTNVLAEHINFLTGSTAVTNEVEFTASSNGVYYFGFNAISAINMWHMYLDNIAIELVSEAPVEGCLDTPNGQYPTTAFTPSCNGTTEVITDLGWFGEFSMVNVTAGTEYIFSTDVPTAFITIANAAGNTAITTGTGSVTWTATESGQVRFITHENSDCLSSQNWVERYVQCGEFVPPPPYDPCAPVHEGIATNGVGFVNNGTDNYMAANDFNVLANTQFEVEKFTINIVTLGGAPTTFDLKFYEGETGVETQFGETMTNVTPSSITDNGTFGSTGYPVYAVEFTLPTTMIFPATATADKRYWIGVSGQPTDSGSPVFWVSSDYTLTDTLPTWQSDNGGDSWFIFVAGSGANVEGDLIIEGECATLGMPEMSSFDFAYHPNPARDILNITSQKSIQSVEVFNLAGQQVMQTSKVANGQVNVQMLPSGTYVFRVRLDGGAVETFKIIKK